METEKRGDKQSVVKRLIAEIAKESGRFLKQNDDGWWVEATESQVLKKVATAFRNEKDSGYMFHNPEATKAVAWKGTKGDKQKRTSIEF